MRFVAIIGSLLIVVVAIPMIFDWVPPNRFYGFRTRATLSSAHEWYRANRLMGIYLAVGQVVGFAAFWRLSQGVDLASTSRIVLCTLALAAPAGVACLAAYLHFRYL